MGAEMFAFLVEWSWAVVLGSVVLIIFLLVVFSR